MERSPRPKADDVSPNRHPALASCLSMIPRVEPEGMLFRKPVHTFRDHALGRGLPNRLRVIWSLNGGCVAASFSTLASSPMS